MSNQFWLTDTQMARLPPFFLRATASRALMIGA